MLYVNLLFYFAEGQKQAKRLAKSITKESANLRKLLKKYNSSVEILRQNGYNEFVDLTWEKASDVSSAIYSVNIPNEDGIPLSVKRAAVDAINLIKRLSEEEQLLVTEMNNCVKAFFSSCKNQEENISSLQLTDDFNDNDFLRGLCSAGRKELYEDQINLQAACNLFREFITIPEEVEYYVEQHFRLTKVLEFDSDDDGDDGDDEDGVDNEDNVENHGYGRELDIEQE